MRLIDANKLMIILQDHCDANCVYTEQERQKTDICDTCLLGDAKDYIDRMPTIEAEPIRHGMWIKMSDAGQDIIFCSECGGELSRRAITSSNPQFDLFLKLKCIDKTAYCPHCGAKMDEEVDENETD